MPISVSYTHLDVYKRQAQTVVKLPLEKIDFQPESTRLTTQAEQDLINQVLPVLRSSRLYLKIEGSSAWPGPEAVSYTHLDVYKRQTDIALPLFTRWSVARLRVYVKHMFCIVQRLQGRHRPGLWGCRAMGVTFIIRCLC